MSPSRIRLCRISRLTRTAVSVASCIAPKGFTVIVHRFAINGGLIIGNGLLNLGIVTGNKLEGSLGAFLGHFNLERNPLFLVDVTTLIGVNVTELRALKPSCISLGTAFAAAGSFS